MTSFSRGTRPRSSATKSSSAYRTRASARLRDPARKDCIASSSCGGICALDNTLESSPPAGHFGGQVRYYGGAFIHAFVSCAPRCRAFINSLNEKPEQFRKDAASLSAAASSAVSGATV